MPPSSFRRGPDYEMYYTAFSVSTVLERIRKQESKFKLDEKDPQTLEKFAAKAMLAIRDGNLKVIRVAHCISSPYVYCREMGYYSSIKLATDEKAKDEADTDAKEVMLAHLNSLYAGETPKEKSAAKFTFYEEEQQEFTGHLLDSRAPSVEADETQETLEALGGDFE
ncbi:uncharacterized protein BDW43DRAFT_309342 [Aspergillus alliaceus]|uniref:uncharacterized protein n=1 Tax=Petromyces alliaceus TaxID=209559 RepID=UPI0012A54521|nr:uncharacterized protein BDW43DRAFT_309342 [Aspergillus alliaceus]KAB8235475.1 hypothetical protein BDW43DRAFT_309342 [Aspergillus alliaceus]